jgi:hypothetical protein
MKRAVRRSFLVVFVIFVAVIGSAVVWAARSHRLILYQHGNPEVPQGHAFAIMNPFRNRRAEEVAEELMSDLRTSRCEQILRELHSEDPRVCPIMGGNKSARLIWREDGNLTRVLVYHLPESAANLWITSRRDEVGFIVDGLSLIR